MDILIDGDLTTIAFSLAKGLLKEGHRVIVAGAPDNFSTIKNRNFVTYKMTPSDDLYKEIYRSHTINTVFYIAPQRKGPLENPTLELAHTFSGLDCVLELSRQNYVGQIVYISSTEVYGEMQIPSKDTPPNPSTSIGQLILNGENLCRFYAKEWDLPTSIIRLPYIYGPGLKGSFLNKLLHKAKENGEICLNTSGLAHCSFLHFEDFFEFIKRLLEDEKKYGLRIFNLTSEDINFLFLTQQINYYFPKVKFSFNNKAIGKPHNKKIETKNAYDFYKWVPQHQLIDTLPTLLETGPTQLPKKRVFTEKIKAFALSFSQFIAMGEVLLDAFLMHMLAMWPNLTIGFKYIDYRLLYVVIIGSTYGLLLGLTASLLASISAAFSWYIIGLDWALLIHNVENWIPFAAFFLAGAVTGYVHDKKENEISFEHQQSELIHEKYEFLYSLYDEISSIKDRLRKQLVGYRDSFGRFFRITNELNELEEDNIFFKALEIIEDLMKNDQISIYSIEPTGNYGRLEVKSKNLTRQIPKSLKLSDYVEALNVLNKGSIFQNKELLPNYPSYIAPIRNQGQLIGMIIIWEAKFEQFTMYYLNLFKVITGLVESSLVRAANFRNAQIEKLFLPATRIMKPDPFKVSLSIRKKMRRNKVAEFLILRIEKGEESWQELYERLSKGIRAEDVIGLLNENDLFCYVLLINASIENIGIIQDRLKDLGVNSKFIKELEID
ncbi:MAG: SDR family oxidoreductase [Anaerolineaceae bacterium]|nr:SDR family oxidoreductase [Anaerolineaceae bacterium]